MVQRTFSFLFASTILSAFLCVSPAIAQNAVANPGFEIPEAGLNPPNYSASNSQFGVRGLSSAANWTLFNNTPSFTTSELLSSTDTLENGEQSMIHITTQGVNDGIFQTFSGLSQARATVDVFVISGSVQLAMYKDGGHAYVGQQVNSTSTNQWERLIIPLTSGNGSQIDTISIYGQGTANFYIDNVRVSLVPAPVCTHHASHRGGSGGGSVVAPSSEVSSLKT